MTAVGGTRLSVDASGRWLGEQAWDYSSLSQGSSGGPSSIFQRPSWQQAYGMSAARDSTHRLTPDVAALADPATGLRCVIGGSVSPGGGTSLSTPLWAAFTVLMDQYLIGHGGRAAGDLNPMLYRVTAGAALPAFHDVVLGGNAVDLVATGYASSPASAAPMSGTSPRTCSGGKRWRPMNPEFAAVQAPPALPCPACGESGQRGAYCGACGFHLTAQTGRDGAGCIPTPLRRPSRVLRFSDVTTLFPHLPHRSHAPFRAGLALLAVLLAALAALRLQAPMVAVSAVGLPLLFQLHLHETDVYTDLSRLVIIGSAGCGAVLGWGWSELSAGEVTRAVAVGLAGHGSSQIWLAGIAIPIAGAVVMLLPIVVLRLRRRADAEGLDGFLLGSAAALGFAAAATVTRLAPQLHTGLVAHGRPLLSLLVEAGLQGVTVPLTAACAGGLFGATLLVRRRDPVHRGRILTSPALAVVVILALYACLGLVDLWQPAELGLFALHAAVAAVLLLALRLGIHGVLLHEHHRFRPGTPIVCQHCLHLVPEMPFCPQCGVAGRATSRTARSALRLPATTTNVPASTEATP